MSRAGDVLENPVTGERAVVRVGTEETNGERLVVDLFIKPGAAVVGEHLHPLVEERFTVLSGRVDFSVDGRHQVAKAGVQLVIPPHTVHDWWNAGDETAHVLVEVAPAARFEELILTLFGLAQDGKTNAKGMPNPLQLALLAGEFDDVIRFTRPPHFVQRALFAILASIAKRLGYRGSYPEYRNLLEPSRAKRSSSNPFITTPNPFQATEAWFRPSRPTRKEP